MPNMKYLKTTIYALILVFTGLMFTGCGSSQLVPKDLKDFLAAHLQTPRRNVEFTQPFRSTVILRVEAMTVDQARQAERDLIEACVEYFRRDNISDYINDTLVFVVRSVTDPDVNLKYWSVADDMDHLVKGSMGLDEFIERCRREENWSDFQ